MARGSVLRGAGNIIYVCVYFTYLKSRTVKCHFNFKIDYINIKVTIIFFLWFIEFYVLKVVEFVEKPHQQFRTYPEETGWECVFIIFFLYKSFKIWIKKIISGRLCLEINFHNKSQGISEGWEIVIS